MENIEVKILDHNFNGMPLFLARLTQRGHLIKNMDDLMNLYNDAINKQPSDAFMSLPHDTIFRMCNMTVAVTGLSTKAASQLRTHATRMTFISTSTQYSNFSYVENPYVLPEGLTDAEKKIYTEALKNIHDAYTRLNKLGLDKDKAGYLLPQGLKKCLIMSGNFPAWEYVLSMRLCNRNTREVQHICEKIVEAIEKEIGPGWAKLCKPECCKGGCKEGKFSCGHKYQKPEVKNEDKVSKVQ